jgi:DNA-binding SARP family transcriptional activator/tetratricopeptide (TPR) repeat protein
MWLGILGPLLIRDDDTTIRVSAGQQRVVLGALLARPNQVVSFDALADVAWAAGPTDTARITIRNYVRRLRQVLGDTVGARIVTRDPGYLIELDDDEYDMLAFTRLTRRGATAAAQGAWQEAADTLGTALSLWRGEPMVDIPSSVLRLREVPRLSELRLQALETSAQAQLHLGRPTAVVADLAELAREHPLRERPHTLLMLALYRTGRQGDALATYQTARRVLTDELGVEPGPELRELHARILRNDPDLLPPAENPPTEGTPPRVAGPAAVVPHQLPPAIPRLAGRASALKSLSDLLTEPTPATVVVIGGTAGVGKTTLALRWAHDVAERFPDGQLYVDLRGFGPADRPATPTEAIRGFLDAFGVPVDRIPKDLPGQTALYRSLLAGKRVLVVLDNARDAAQVRPLLPGSPTCRVVVTSRSELTGLVATEGARALSLDVLSDLEAADLLTGRLDAERTASEPGAVAELTDLCARLPLALSVVAARAAVRPQLPLAAFVTELRDASGRLDALDVGDTAVRGVFSWSYRGLSAAARRMFRLLGSHAGPDISLAAAASLAGLARADAGRVLAELTRVHLVGEHVPRRFHLHDLLHAYAAEQAVENESRAAVRRLLDHYLATADDAATRLQPARESARPPGLAAGVTPERNDDEHAARVWLIAEHATLLAAINQAVDLGFDEHAYRLPWSLIVYFDRQGHWDDWAATQRIAAAAAERLGDLPAVAHTRRALGFACLRLRRHDEAGAHYTAALALYQQLGDRTGQGHSHRGLSEVRERQGRDDLALEHAEQALDLYVAAGNRAGQAHALNDLGWCHCQLGDYAQAVDRCRQALELHTEVGDRHGAAATWDSLGYAYQHLGDHPQAVRCYWENVHVMRELGDRFREAGGMARLGEAYLAADDVPAAKDCFRQALVILDDIHHPNAGTVRAKLAELR